MPDLGKYAAEVGIAYSASLILIVGLVLFTVVRARRARNDLRKLEQRMSNRG